MSGKQRIPELLAPAGNMEKLITAIHYGADAVYLGGEEYSLRARAGNFSIEELGQAVTYAHAHDTKVYATVNIFAHNRDLTGLAEHFINLEKAGVDGLIIADPGVFMTARETVPSLPVHLSTQANITNAAAVRFWRQQGVTRCNLARELGIEEIREIRQVTDAELEIFVHGALCISYSGRCLLSTYFTGRDSNQGDCAHPCRYSYRIEEEKRPGQFFPVEEDERGTYIFNSKDLCLLRRLPQLVAVGADSLKIEGRMKSVGYVGQVVRVYRAALDWLQEKLAEGADAGQLILPDIFAEELEKTGTRGGTENFFQSSPSSGDMMYATMRMAQSYAPVGIVRQEEPLCIEARNVLQTGDRITYLGQGMENSEVLVCSMRDAEGNKVERANPGNLVELETDPPLLRPKLHAILRKKITV